MQSSFDARTACFDPDQTAILSAAYRLALKSFETNQRVPASTKSKLAKVVVNLGRQRLQQHVPLDAEEISEQASKFAACLQAAEN